MNQRLCAVIAVFTVFFALSGCKKEAKQEVQKAATTSGVTKNPAESTAADAPFGTIEGVVRLEKGAKTPSYPPQMMVRQVLDITEPAPIPESCSPLTEDDRQPVKLTEEGTLAGVMVAASDYSRIEKRPPVTHEVVLEDCRLKPMLVIAVQGDKLRLRSNTDYPFMPELDGAALTQTLIKGQEKLMSLDRGGIQRLLCGFTAPCGRTDVVVVFHPLYTITDGKGAFRIERIPAGEQLTLNAWHPLFRETNIKLSVQPNEVRRVEFSLAPLPESVLQPTPDKSAVGRKPRGSDSGKGRPRPARRDPTILR